MFEAIVEPVSSDSNPTNTPVVVKAGRIENRNFVSKQPQFISRNASILPILQLIVQSPSACIAVAIQPSAHKEVRIRSVCPNCVARRCDGGLRSLA